MQTLGIVGGIGPESTIEYYRRLLERWRRQGESGQPPLLINSIEMQKMLDLITAGQWPALADMLLAEVEKLARAGAAFALIAANTPHVVFPQVASRSPIPLISIVEATAAAAQALGLKKLGLFGTRFTMQGSFYQDVFSRWQLAIALPDSGEQEYIHEKYFGELVRGQVLPATREHLLKIVDALKAREQVQGLILGGTELSLIFREDSVCGIPVLDTTQIHVNAAVARMLA
ncbi:MAG TPA: amino acid racemase [Candidatus Angelobacter sp.]